MWRERIEFDTDEAMLKLGLRIIYNFVIAFMSYCITILVDLIILLSKFVDAG